MTAFSFGSVDEKLNIFAVADMMEQKGKSGFFFLIIKLVFVKN